MPVLTLSEAQLSWGDLPVLDKADFSLQEGERVGLIGRNGTGKTSLLKVLSRLVPLDEGELRIVTGTRCILVEQEPILPTAPTLLESLYLRAGSLFKGDEPTLFSEKALLTGSWWMIVIPGVFLVATLLSLTEIGNAIRRELGHSQKIL